MADNEVFELGADDLPARVQPTAIAAHGHRLARYLHPCGPAHPSGRSQFDRLTFPPRRRLAESGSCHSVRQRSTLAADGCSAWR